MKTIKAYKKQLAKDVETFLEDGPATVTAIETTLKELFPFAPHQLSSAEKIFEQNLAEHGFDAYNSVLAKCLPATRDLLAKGISHILLLERFISLNVPAMEDGNNFGVSVQMVVAKALKDIRESWTKKLEAIPSYYSSRADSVDKLGLSKTTQSVSKTETDTTSTGGKDGEEKKQCAVGTKEEKTTGGSKPDAHRVKHVVAIDLQCYADLQSTLALLVDGYMTILDNLEKNKDKLTAPKGTSGGGSNMSMY